MSLSPHGMHFWPHMSSTCSMLSLWLAAVYFGHFICWSFILNGFSYFDQSTRGCSLENYAGEGALTSLWGKTHMIWWNIHLVTLLPMMNNWLGSWIVFVWTLYIVPQPTYFHCSGNPFFNHRYWQLVDHVLVSIHRVMALRYQDLGTLLIVSASSTFVQVKSNIGWDLCVVTFWCWSGLLRAWPPPPYCLWSRPKYHCALCSLQPN